VTDTPRPTDEDTPGATTPTPDAPLDDAAGTAPEADDVTSSTQPVDSPTEPVAPVTFDAAAVPVGLPPNPPTEPAPVVYADGGAEPAPAPKAPSPLRHPAFIAVSIALVLALILAAVGWVRLGNEQDHADDLEARVDELEAQVEELQAQGEQGSGGTLDDLLGDEELQGTLDDLLSGEGDLGDIGGLLDELLGGEGQGLEGLGGLLEGLLGEENGLGDLFGESTGGASPFGIGGPSAVLACMDAGALGSVDLPDDDLDAQYDAMVGAVEQARGLEFEDVPEPTYLSFDEIDERVRQEVEESYGAADSELDGALLAALGVVEPGTNMEELQSDFVGEGQVAGFYDPDTGEMVIGTDNPDEPLSGVDLITLAHELDHALVDQAIGLPDIEESAESDADAAFAEQTLTEGDATLLMNDIAIGSMDLGGMLGGLDSGALAEQQAGIEQAPHYLARQLLFPYTQGLEFSCALREDGGWETVNEAYRELPTTSAQMMWPDRYLDGEDAADASDPGDPGGGWDEARTTTLGAADLLFLFEAPGDDTGAALDDPVDRAAAWAGGEVVQYTDGDDHAIGISLVQRDGEADLCASMMDWYEAGFPDATVDRGSDTMEADGSDQAAVITCDGDDVKIGIAPDLATARRLAG
jgi:hypothetical protein